MSQLRGKVPATISIIKPVNGHEKTGFMHNNNNALVSWSILTYCIWRGGGGVECGTVNVGC